jgi:hypothetical protein
VVGCWRVVDGRGLHPECGTGAGHSRADAGALHTADDSCGLAVGKTADLLDHREEAVGAVGALDPGYEDQLGISRRLRSVHRGLGFSIQTDRGHHAGQDNLIGEGQHGQVKGLGH